MVSSDKLICTTQYLTLQARCCIRYHYICCHLYCELKNRFLWTLGGERRLLRFFQDQQIVHSLNFLWYYVKYAVYGFNDLVINFDVFHQFITQLFQRCQGRYWTKTFQGGQMLYCRRTMCGNLLIKISTLPTVQ